MSPENHRKNADDVIVLITDGEPSGSRAIMESKRYARILKSERKVLIVGVGVGKIAEPKLTQILRDISSPGQTLTEANFKEFNKIMGHLVAKSCQREFGIVCSFVYGYG